MTRKLDCKIILTNPHFLTIKKSLLNPQFTNLCKCVASAVLKFAVLKIIVKIEVYKPM